jgi:hypothetical protein
MFDNDRYDFDDVDVDDKVMVDGDKERSTLIVVGAIRRVKGMVTPLIRCVIDLIIYEG